MAEQQNLKPANLSSLGTDAQPTGKFSCKPTTCTPQNQQTPNDARLSLCSC